MNNEKNIVNTKNEAANNNDKGFVKGTLLPLIVDVGIAAFISFLLFFVLFRIVIVSGTSMMPTYEDGNILIVNHIKSKTDFGTVVVVDSKNPEIGQVIKRVIGVGGDTIDIDFDKGIVYRNGEALDEPYVNSPTNTKFDVEFPLRVPEGCLFVMGDNRNMSLDSRSSEISFVPLENVIGSYMFQVPFFGHNFS